ncbi:hypothetical protein ACF0H5_023938 [Mactra antiquata]
MSLKLDLNEDISCSSDDVISLNNDEKATQCTLTESAVGGEKTKDIAVVTDLCNDSDLPEVEIFSLIEEQIPRYRLRADTVTNFAGYSNYDWIQTPVLPEIDDADLTPELVEETLKYFSKYSLIVLILGLG